VTPASTPCSRSPVQAGHDEGVAGAQVARACSGTIGTLAFLDRFGVDALFEHPQLDASVAQGGAERHGGAVMASQSAQQLLIDRASSWWAGLHDVWALLSEQTKTMLVTAEYCGAATPGRRRQGRAVARR